MTNTRVELLKEMQEIVDKNVKHFKSDFMYDIDFIYALHDKKIIWITRNCGTNIVRLFPDEKNTTARSAKEIVQNSKDILKYYLEVDNKGNKFFLIDLENNTIENIGRAAAADYLK